MKFELVDADVVPILGLEACVGLGIQFVKRVDTLSNQAILYEFADCFEEIGCFEREHTIQIDPEVKPVKSSLWQSTEARTISGFACTATD